MMAAQSLPYTREFADPDMDEEEHMDRVENLVVYATIMVALVLAVIGIWVFI